MNRTKVNASPQDSPMNGIVDERLQLVNARERGPIEQVSLPETLITSLHGILLDIDPGRLHPEIAPKTVHNPEMLLPLVQPWLKRHPVFARAKIVFSGSGLHVIVRLSPSVEFESEAMRQKWAAVVRITQRLLPTDPDCPGITALTRPVGSINGKNGKKVVCLCKGEPVNPDEVLALTQQAVAKPFATVAGLLYSEPRITPCPGCEAEGSRLDVLDRYGMCYGGCGRVSVGKIFDRFMRPRASYVGGK